MNVERVTHVDDALLDAVARLVPQLSPSRKPPERADLEKLVAASDTSLFLARNGDAVLGMLALVVYRVPTGLRGWIHDVVVDDAARGRGVGEALTRAALEHARADGVATVHLTTRPQREAANRLYRRLGFEQHETNVYVWRPE